MDHSVNLSAEIESNSNPFLVQTQSRSDSALISRSTNSDSDELTQLRRQLDAVKNENFELKRTAQQDSLPIPSSQSILSNTYPHKTVQRSNYSQNAVQNSRYKQNQAPNSNFSQYSVPNRDLQQYQPIRQPITESSLLPMQHPSGPQYINTSEVPRFNDNGCRTRVPFYNGKDPWNAYVMLFELIAEMNNWTPLTKAIELVTALKDEAMVYASFLTTETKRSFSALCAAMSNRFGDHGYPETYRQELHTLRKQNRETIQEYVSSVEMLVRKSFPTIETATHSTLSIEYLLRGLPDQSIAIELLTKRITSITEAIHQVTLYETYKRGTRDRNIRQLGITEDSYRNDCGSEDIEVRRFVTEERLTQFERGILESLKTVIQREMGMYYTQQDYDSSPWQNKQVYRDHKTKMKNPRCFNCNEESHYIKKREALS
ncbi:unnamed protein product [Mytilus coruscus]|uniref:Retrotransposon gag domain-containing protein n=1 Tax=Mytilus coruscus TaxID=42192 RepID=A0A6J8BB75_MYTCO|nr:unnamed protein product [Mytilus coruscus]